MESNEITRTVASTYRAPVITDFGTVRSLTAGNTNGSFVDNGSMGETGFMNMAMPVEP